jgi:hypothetical protein
MDVVKVRMEKGEVLDIRTLISVTVIRGAPTPFDPALLLSPKCRLWRGALSGREVSEVCVRPRRLSL